MAIALVGVNTRRFQKMLSSQMHRISLRGPWQLDVDSVHLRGSRRFHAPTGIETATDGGPRSFIFFHIRSVRPWPVIALELNGQRWDAVANTSLAGIQTAARPRFRWDPLEGHGWIDITGILTQYNIVTCCWATWPADWQPRSERYTPGPTHRLHFDSWLEIHESTATVSD